jgi:hypothetical protein
MSELGKHLEASLGVAPNLIVKSGFLARTLRYMADAIDAGFQKHSERISGLERKLSEAERKGFGIRYAGVYKDGKSYEAGQFATHQGGLWHCNEDTSTRPGTGPHWTLAVKSGDAR